MGRLRMLVVMLALALVGGIVPVRAQEQGVSLPPLVIPKSMRNQGVWTLNGRPVRVFQTRFESADRRHAVVHELADVTVFGQQLVAGRRRENIRYDGFRYMRVDNEATWTKTPLRNYQPGQDIFSSLGSYAITKEVEGVLTRLGPATFAGTPLTHYQFWVSDPDVNMEAGGQETEDYWISSDGRIHYTAYSVLPRVLGLDGMDNFEFVNWYDFDAPIVVAPPPASLVK